MAVRLPVILSQPARRDASTTDLVENLVAAALLIPGLDANLIGDIGTIEPGSTDHVCLLGHTRDLVLASFLQFREARAAWQRLEQSGLFVDLAQDEADIRASLRGATAGRKVFYYQLAIGQSVDSLLAPCRKLLAAQQLSLVSLHWRPGTGNGSGGNGNGSSAPSVKTLVPLSPPASPLPRSRVDGGSPSAGRPAQAASTEQVSDDLRASHVESEEYHEQYQEWSALDKLVDDLDAMDL